MQTLPLGSVLAAVAAQVALVKLGVMKLFGPFGASYAMVAALLEDAV
jgi:hypothetical protein